MTYFVLSLIIAQTETQTKFIDVLILLSQMTFTEKKVTNTVSYFT